MNRAVIYILRLSGISCNLSGEHSAFSGITSTNFVISNQKLRVSLDFSNADTILLAAEECPAYVQGCFRAESSESFTFVSQWEKRFESFGWIKGLLGEEDVILGDFSPLRLRLFVVTETKPVTVKFREVAGKVGLGRGSPFTRDSIFSIKRSRVGSSEVEIQWKDIPTNTGMISAWLGSGRADEYSFYGTLRLGPSVLSSSAMVVFDPSETVVVLPHVSQNLGPLIRVKEDGFIAVKEPMDLNLILPTGLIRIPFKTLVEKTDSDTEWMHLQIRIASAEEDVHCVRIGRHLVHATERIVIDNTDSRIWFAPIAEYKEPEEELGVVRPLVPVFLEPKVYRSTSKPVWIRFPLAEASPKRSERSSHLLLFKDKSSLSQDLDEERIVEVFVFIRCEPRLKGASLSAVRVGSEDTTYSVDPSFKYPWLFRFAQLLLLPEQGRSEVFLIHSDISVSVLIEGPLVSDHHGAETLVGKSVFLRKQEMMTESCVVCMSDFAAGETIQSLSCGHRFHFDCLQPWVSSGKTECIMCRASFTLD